jgi:hypothetical protein
VSFLKKGGCVH